MRRPCFSVKRFGGVDAVFANAGIMPAGNMSELKVEGWMAEVDVNVKGVLNLIAAAIPTFKERGCGHVIATSSMAGLQSVPGNAVYCGTKHFVRALLSSLRAESVQEGSRIRTTCAYPGAVSTELLSTVDEGAGKEMAKQLYDAVAIQPADIARAVVFAVAQPDGVDISDIAVQPLLQPQSRRCALAFVSSAGFQSCSWDGSKRLHACDNRLNRLMLHKKRVSRPSKRRNWTLQV